MKKFALLFAAAVAMTFCTKIVTADDASGGKGEKVTGVLIDEHCAEGVMKVMKEDAEKGEKKLASHKVSCANKCIDGGSAVVLISGKDELKLDDKGQDMAKEYLKKEGAKSKVVVTGEKDGDTFKVADIKAYEEDKEAK